MTTIDNESSDLSSVQSDIEPQIAEPVTTPKRGSKRAAPATNGQNSARKRVKQEDKTPEKGKASTARSSAKTKNSEDPPPTPPSKTARERKKKAQSQAETEADNKSEAQEEAWQADTTKQPRKRAAKGKATPEAQKLSDTETPVKKPRPRKAAPTTTPAAPDEADPPSDSQPTSQPQTKVKRKRKTAEEKAAEAMPLAARTTSAALQIGAHVSASGGVHNAVGAAVHIGANAFALFLKSQRKWANPALKDEHSDAFHSACKEHGFSADKHIVPHGSYLVNLAAKDEAKKVQAYDSFLDDIKRCETLAIKLYNFHPGNTNGEPRAEAIERLAARLNEAHSATKSVVTLLENMAARPEGNTIGATFADLRDVIALVKDKSRVGVCLDTCHAFAAGYDLRSPEAFKTTMADFDETVGMKYLRALHINDSKAPFASHRDLHANIGTGFLGLRAFHNLVNEPRLQGLPLVLETPIDRKTDEKDAKGKAKTLEDKGIWATEIKLLESLVGMDVDGEHFRKLEQELAEKGQEEREKHQEQFERLEKERAKKKAGGGRKGKKKGASSESEGESVEESE